MGSPLPLRPLLWKNRSADTGLRPGAFPASRGLKEMSEQRQGQGQGTQPRNKVKHVRRKGAPKTRARAGGWASDRLEPLRSPSSRPGAHGPTQTTGLHPRGPASSAITVGDSQGSAAQRMKS